MTRQKLAFKFDAAKICGNVRFKFDNAARDVKLKFIVSAKP